MRKDCIMHDLRIWVTGDLAANPQLQPPAFANRCEIYDPGVGACLPLSDTSLGFAKIRIQGRVGERSRNSTLEEGEIVR